MLLHCAVFPRGSAVDIKATHRLPLRRDVCVETCMSKLKGVHSFALRRLWRLSMTGRRCPADYIVQGRDGGRLSRLGAATQQDVMISDSSGSAVNQQ